MNLIPKVNKPEDMEKIKYKLKHVLINCILMKKRLT